MESRILREDVAEKSGAAARKAGNEVIFFSHDSRIIAEKMENKNRPGKERLGDRLSLLIEARVGLNGLFFLTQNARELSLHAFNECNNEFLKAERFADDDEFSLSWDESDVVVWFYASAVLQVNNELKADHVALVVRVDCFCDACHEWFAGEAEPVAHASHEMPEFLSGELKLSRGEPFPE